MNRYTETGPKKNAFADASAGVVELKEFPPGVQGALLGADNALDGVEESVKMLEGAIEGHAGFIGPILRPQVDDREGEACKAMTSHLAPPEECTLTSRVRDVSDRMYRLRDRVRYLTERLEELSRRVDL